MKINVASCLRDLMLINLLKPVQPTWSIQSLLDSPSDPISDEQFDRLLELARLNKPTNPEKLKQDIDKLAQLTGHIKGHAYDVAPLRSIWKEGEGQILRSDDVIESDNDGEKRGRSLLKHAQKTSGNFYTVAE